MKKIKILFVVSDLRRCGPTNQLFGIISNLKRNEFDFKIITLNKEPIDTEIELFINNNINIKCINNKKRKIFSQTIRLKREIRLFEPDIIHTSGIRANLIATFVKKKKNQIITLRNNAYQEYPMQMNKIKSYIAIKLTELAINKTDYCVCCSNSLKRNYINHGFNNIFAIQNGVNTKKYNINSGLENQKFLDSLKLDNHRKIFIVSGLMNIRKNILIIIEAFLNSDRINDSYLIFIGDGDLKEEAIKFSKEHKNIIYKGRVNNVAEYLNISDYYISASKAEGLPNSVLEAGCTGLKMILSNIPEHKEIQEELNVSNIIFFNYNDLSKLIEILNTCIYKTKNSEKEYISNTFSNTFSSAKMSNKYSRLYKEVAQQ